LVHPALTLSGGPRRVLVLGGGDGLGLREILKHKSVEAVTLVDIDSEMTGLAKRYLRLAELNHHSFDDPRGQVANDAAMIWLEEGHEHFDGFIVDFPAPSTYSLGKFYTPRFSRLLNNRLTDNAAVAAQPPSPLFARRSYWCIVRTLEAAAF